jgi:drug/metabolite transporter (DMT)-like permease
MIRPESAGIALLFAMLLWASSFIALKWAFMVYPPMWVIAGRMVVGLCCFSLLWKQILKFEYRAGDWRLLTLISVCEPCLFFLLESQALMYTSASQAGMMTALAPILTACAALIFLQERLSRMRWLGFSVAVAGVIILTVTSEKDISAPNPILGNSLEFLAIICGAVYSIGFKILCQRYSPITLTALQSLVGTLFFLPIALMTEGDLVFDSKAILATLYLGMFVTLGAYLLYNIAVSVIPVTKAAAFINLIPVFTVFLAYFFLDERLSWIQWSACGVVFLGVWLTQRRVKPKKSVAEIIHKSETNS